MKINEHTLSRRLLLGLFFLVLFTGMAFFARQGRELVGLVVLLALMGAVIISRRPELGIVLFLTTFFVSYSQFLPVSGRLTPNNLLGLLFVVMLLLKTYQDRDLWFLKERPIQLFLLLTVFIFISSYIAEQRFGNPFPELDATGAKLDRLMPRFIFLLFFVNFIRTYRDVKLVLWTVIAVILLAAASAVPGPGNYRVVAAMGISAAGNPNWFAFFCELGIALIWSYRYMIRQKWMWSFLTAIVGGLAIIVLMTASRSGFINLVLLFTLLTMQGRFSIKRQLQTVLVVVLVGYLAVSLLSSTHLERLGNILPGGWSETKGSGSSEDRLRTVKNGLKMVAQEPLFGIGIGNFVWFHLQISEEGKSTAPHNSYLWAVTEGGIPVLLLYLLLFGYTFASFRRVEQKAIHPELRAIASGLRIGFLVFLSFSVFAEFWLNIMTYIFVGLAIVLRRLQEREILTHFPGVATRVENQAAPA